MKTFETRTTAYVVGFVLAMLIVITSFLSLQNGSSRLTAAAVVERANVVDSRLASDSAGTNSRVAGSASTTGSADAAGSDAALRTPAEIAQNRVTEEARKAARSLGKGEASYYGAGFAGRLTANGERFNPAEMTAAHRTLPFGSKVRVTNLRNGRSVVVRVNDRGPYADNRVIDLSRGAAERIGMVQSGTANVQLELIS